MGMNCLEVLLEQVPLDSDRKAAKVAHLCDKYRLSDLRTLLHCCDRGCSRECCSIPGCEVPASCSYPWQLPAVVDLCPCSTADQLTPLQHAPVRLSFLTTLLLASTCAFPSDCPSACLRLPLYFCLHSCMRAQERGLPVLWDGGLLTPAASPRPSIGICKPRRSAVSPRWPTISYENTHTQGGFRLRG